MRVGIIALMFACASLQAEPWTTPFGGQRVTMHEVFGEPRSAAVDQVILRNGDCLAGRVAWDAVRFQTPMGVMPVRMNRIAGLDFGLEMGKAEQLAGVNGDVFTGMLLEESLPLEIAGGSKVMVPRALIERVIARMREGELDGIPRRQTVRLTNDDHFTGGLDWGALHLRTRRGRTGLSAMRLDTLAPEDWTPGAALRTITGERVRGHLSAEALHIEPDLCAGAGPKVLLEVPLLRVAQVLGDDARSTQARPRAAAPLPAQVIMGVKEVDVGAGPVTGDLTDGPDLFSFRAQRGQRYKISTDNLVACDTVITLMRADGTTTLMENDDGPNPNSPASQIAWACSEGGLHCVRVRELTGARRGRYTVQVEVAGGGAGSGGTWFEQMSKVLAAWRN